ncbi:MAG: molybdate ABC transporter permease subunit [Bacteroidota bacterium]
MNWEPILLTFQLSLITTLLLILIAIPLAYWLTYTKFRGKIVLEALISMPLVLPPTVLGFYILVAFSPNNSVGRFLQENLGLQLAFSFEGLVLASILYSLPFMVQPIAAGFASLSPSLKEAAYVLGKSRMETLIWVLLPNIRGAILTGIVLAFAHTIGEFGVVLMIGGSIPGQTRVASIAIYEEVEALNYGLANSYSLFLFVVSFCILLVVYGLNRNSPQRVW